MTATQATVDTPNKKDHRAGRSASENIIPATTGANASVTIVCASTVIGIIIPL